MSHLDCYSRLQRQLTSALGRRTRKKAQLRDSKEILDSVQEKADALLTEVNNCRDAVIQKTGNDTQQTLDKVEMIYWKATDIKELVSRVQRVEEIQPSIMGNVSQKQDFLLKLSQCREDSNAGLLWMILDQQSNKCLPLAMCQQLLIFLTAHQATITQLESIIELLTTPDPIDLYITSLNTN